MNLKLPRYVHAYSDRHGKQRFYVRKPGFKRVPLPGLPWSTEFMDAHAAALAGCELNPPVIGASRTVPGTINALAIMYYNSAEFQKLSCATRATYRGLIEGFRVEHGDKRIATMHAVAVSALIARKATTPAAANNLLRIIRLLMRFAIRNGLRRDDPTIGIKPLKMRAGGFYTWSEDDIAKFETKHSVGSRARLALDLMLWTGQRRGDVIHMGRQHVRNGVLSIRQHKTGALVEIPVHTQLQASIEAVAKDHLSFLVTEAGKPFTAAGFGNWFKDMCKAAGVAKECSAHGLRKAAARRLAEAGCTAHEIMSITGHKTLREVTRYTEAADRKRLARDAMAKTASRTSGG